MDHRRMEGNHPKALTLPILRLERGVERPGLARNKRTRLFLDHPDVTGGAATAVRWLAVFPRPPECHDCAASAELGGAFASCGGEDGFEVGFLVAGAGAV